MVWLKKVKIEKKELVSKQEKLTKFLGSKEFNLLSNYEQELLVEQERLMLGYIRVLSRRIDVAEV